METPWKTAESAFGVLCAIGWLAGVIAWARRGFGIPKPVHATAGALIVVGIISAAVAYGAGIRSLWFTVCAVVGFPAWAYAGWFFMGCPGPDRKQVMDAYDISAALTEKTKRK